MSKIKLIENWCIVPSKKSNSYKPPELAVKNLKGDLECGNYVRTSAILGVNKDGHVVTKSGSIYKLGKIDPKYLEAYPDALEQIEKLSQKSTDDSVGAGVTLNRK